MLGYKPHLPAQGLQRPRPFGLGQGFPRQLQPSWTQPLESDTRYDIEEIASHRASFSVQRAFLVIEVS
jgi:hypothetical protein